jgi:hypothetical protein
VSPTLATIIGGLAVAAITGIVSWVVATSRAVGRLEAGPSSPPPAPAPPPLCAEQTAKILALLSGIQTRLDTEKEYRWPQQDKILADVTDALKDVDRALRALLDSRPRPGA